MHISIDGIVYRIVEFQHVKPGKGGAFVRTKLKALSSGSVVDKTFRAGEKMPRVRTEVTNVTYIYNDGTDVVLMDSETFEQIHLPLDTLADELRFMRENDTVQLLLVDGKPTAVQLPASVELRGDRDRAGGQGRHRLQRDQAGDARDRRGRAGAAVRRTWARRSRSTRARRGTSRGRDQAGRHHRSAAVAAATGRHDLDRRRCSTWPRSSTPPVSRRSRSPAAAASTRPSSAAPRAPGNGCGRSRRDVRETPLQMALRGRFLVGSKPVSDDLTRRFILCAAESGIDIFRLHDPLNDVENLTAAAAAVREAGGRLYAGLAFSGQMANLDRVLDKAKRLADLGADHVLLHDPAGRARSGHLRPRGGAAGRGGGRARSGSTARARARWRWRSRPPATARPRWRWRPIPSPTRSTAFPARCCARP